MGRPTRTVSAPCASPPATYYAKETTAPAGFLAIAQLATDADGTGAGTTRDYTNKIGPLTITSGNTLTIPNNTGLVDE